MACFVVCGFLAGLTLCLIPHFDDHHHGSDVPSSVIHTAQACGTSAIPCEGQLAPNNLLLILFLGAEQSILYEGLVLSPPSPPPRV